jgi:hypothetical protein
MTDQLGKLGKLCSAFGAKTEKSEHRFYVRNRVNPIDLSDPNVYHKTEVVGGIAIHIPEYMLNDFLDMFSDRKFQDMEIRMNVPAVKKAYEHYKLLLNMCRGDNDAGY